MEHYEDAESGMDTMVKKPHDQGKSLDTSPEPARPAWQQWADSDNPHDAVEKLRERAEKRTRGAMSPNSTEMLREMREERHRKG
jgi:hypothetical protein